MRVENETKLEPEKTGVNAQKPQLKIPFKNSISGPAAFCKKVWIVFQAVLLHNVDAHNVNVTGRVCYLT
jgi:hypothetical protein